MIGIPPAVPCIDCGTTGGKLTADCPRHHQRRGGRCYECHNEHVSLPVVLRSKQPLDLPPPLEFHAVPDRGPPKPPQPKPVRPPLHIGPILCTVAQADSIADSWFGQGDPPFIAVRLRDKPKEDLS